MANNNTTKVKVYLCDDNSCAKIKEVRLLIIKDVTFSLLQQKIKGLFPDLTSFALTWIDEDSDYITVSTDEELQQALALVSNNTLKIFIKGFALVSKPETTPLVKLQEAQPMPVSSSPSETMQQRQKPELLVHPNIVCDGCNKMVVGPRFKCLACDDYDLCQDCMVLNTHFSHDMIRIVAPTRLSDSRDWFKPIQHIWQKLARHSAHIEKKDEKVKSKIEKHCRRSSKRFHKKCGEPEEDGGFESSPAFPFCANPYLGYNPYSKHSLLKNIGASVANLLDPLGINVTIDVENSDGEIEPCSTCPIKKDANTSPAEETSEAKKDSDNPTNLNGFGTLGGLFGQTNTENPETLSLGSILTNIRDMSGNLFEHMNTLDPKERSEFMHERVTEVQGILCEVLRGMHENKPENQPPSTTTEEPAKATTTENVAESFDTSATACKKPIPEMYETGAIPKRPSSSDLLKCVAESVTPTANVKTTESPDMDWTVINREGSPVQETAAANNESVKTVTFGSDIVEPPKTASIYPALVPIPSPEEEKFLLALNQMIHMGYSNEGGWLLALIKAKKGDVAAVLDVLHPNNSA